MKPGNEPKTPRRVVLFGTFAPSLVAFRGTLIEEMVRRGHRVFAIASDIQPDIAQMLRELGAEPVSVTIGRTSLNPFEALKAQRRLRRLLRVLRPDVLIAYTIKPIIIGAPAARSAGVPRIVSLVTGLGYAFTGGREVKRIISRLAAATLYRRAFSKCSIAIFQNPDDLSDFRRLKVLPASVATGLINGSGIDIHHFVESPAPTAASFLMIARLVGDKGIREFAAAGKRLKQEHPEVPVSLVGWIDTEPHAISQAELDEMIANGINYLGAIKDVRQTLAEHSVYVLPSYREGTPRSVLEAMSTGRPIITTDTPGCRETVTDGENGYLVPARDPQALYEAMIRFVRNPQIIPSMGKASRRKAEAKYDVRKVNYALLEYAHL